MDLIAIGCRGNVAPFLSINYREINIAFGFILIVDYVIIHRFKWQKVGAHPASEKNLLVRAIAWRNNEKMIAIECSSDLVTLLEIENHQEMHLIQLGCDIRYMSWTNNTQPTRSEHHACILLANECLMQASKVTNCLYFVCKKLA